MFFSNLSLMQVNKYNDKRLKAFVYFSFQFFATLKKAYFV